VGFHLDRDTLTASLATMDDRVQRAVNLVFDYMETAAESKMRADAPWTDRTGNARAGLRARHVESGGDHTLVLFHTMDYGVYLEVSHDGEYAIIGPTQIWAGVQLERLLEAAVGRAMRGAA
jgi:hypothetical protein